MKIKTVTQIENFMKNKFFVVLAVSFVIFVLSGIATAQLPNCSEPGSIMRVTKSRSGKFELVTFELKANDPNYEVKDAKPPFYDYSGDNKLRIKGKAFKSIIFRDVAWQCKIRENFSAATSTVMGIKNVEQFEGQVEYVIGYSNKSKFVSSYVYGVGSSKVVLKFKR
jgi:hypothetical protein